MKRYAALVLVAGCAPAPRPHATPTSSPPASPAPSTVPAAPTARAAAGSATPSSSAPKAAGTGLVPCPAAAPPPAIAPPEARTAQPGDGIWTALGDAQAGERAARGEPAVYRTVLHPHAASRFVTVTLAALDLCRLRLGYVPGKQDVPKVESPIERGLVPEIDQAELVAVFNGGYKPEHGKFGMLVSGTSLVPPRDGACTVGLTRTGGVTVASQLPSPELLAYRQTPPCLFENGALHARLAAADERPWGGRAKDLVTRRRSGLGIDAQGRFLFYAAGEEASPQYLAKALLAAGSSTGVQLDINWYWTRFLLFGEREGRLTITSKLIPGMEHQSTSYVERPSDRDFFYVLRRRPAAAL